MEFVFYQTAGIAPTFLNLPVKDWPTDASYLEAKSIVSSLHVVNDAAERAVKFGSDYTRVLTKNEDRRQEILQTVELARRAFPHATRKCFLSGPSSTDSVEDLMNKVKYDARHDQ